MSQPSEQKLTVVGNKDYPIHEVIQTLCNSLVYPKVNNSPLDCSIWFEFFDSLKTGLEIPNENLTFFFLSHLAAHRNSGNINSVQDSLEGLVKVADEMKRDGALIKDKVVDEFLLLGLVKERVAMTCHEIVKESKLECFATKNAREILATLNPLFGILSTYLLARKITRNLN